MTTVQLVAITHRNAPLHVLERTALDRRSADAMAAKLRAMRGVEEATVLATCNRTELYLLSRTTDSWPWLAELSTLTGAPLCDLAGAATLAVDDRASLHLFRVAAGLESRIVGERQILRQVRLAAARAAATGTAGPELDALFQRAVAAARRIHRQRPDTVTPSLARTALDAVTSPGPTLAPVLVLGAGALAGAFTTELARRHLPYRVAARQLEQAVRLTRHPQDAVTFDRVSDELGHTDLVVCATSAPKPVISISDVVHAMSRRPSRPLTILDVAMPRNVDPDAAGVPDVTLRDLDGFKADAPCPHAHHPGQLVLEEHARYESWLAGRSAAALIADLHTQVHALVLSEAKRVLGDSPGTDRLAHRAAAKLVHGPTQQIKDLTAQGDDIGIANLVRSCLAAAGTDPADRGWPIRGTGTVRDGRIHLRGNGRIA